MFSNLVVSLGGAALEALDREMSPKLAQHGMQVALDPAAVCAGGRRCTGGATTMDLAEDQRRLLHRTHLGFVRSGAGARHGSEGAS